MPDIFHLPIPVQTDQSHIIPGVELHANVVAQLLRLAEGKSRPIRSTSEGVERLLLALGSFAGAAIGLWIRSPWRYCFALAAAMFSIVPLRNTRSVNRSGFPSCRDLADAVFALW